MSSPNGSPIDAVYSSKTLSMFANHHCSFDSDRILISDFELNTSENDSNAISFCQVVALMLMNVSHHLVNGSNPHSI